MNEAIQKYVDRLQEARAFLLDVLGRVGERGDEQLYSDGAQWTIRQLAIHLMIADAGHVNMLKGIASGNEIITPDYDVERFNRRSVEKNNALTIAQAIEGMARSRQELLDWLATIDESVLDKQGLHASMQVLSIRQILNVMAAHETAHAKDIEAYLNG